MKTLLLLLPALLFFCFCSSTVSAQKSDSAKAKVRRGYYNYSGMGILTGRTKTEGVSASQNNSSVQFQTVNGYRFNNYLSAGIGLGLETLTSTEIFYPYDYNPISQSSGSYALSTFGECRLEFMKGRISPFICVDFGFNSPLFTAVYENSNALASKLTGGALYGASFGVRRNLKRSGFSLSVGYWYDEYYNIVYPNPGNNLHTTTSVAFQALNARFGWMFW